MNSVNHPLHYNQGNIECIDAMLSAFGKDSVFSFCICNTFKYIWRAEEKNGKEDLEKAQWYLNKALDIISKEENKQLSLDFKEKCDSIEDIDTDYCPDSDEKFKCGF